MWTTVRSGNVKEIFLIRAERIMLQQADQGRKQTILLSLEETTVQRTRFAARKRLSSAFLRESLCPALTALTSSLEDYDSLSNNNVPKQSKKGSKRQNKINEVS